ncbi:uncharacterized protein YALI1_D20398g [Yarrowia lipolytica]|uniref:Uncharacterized protein n=1 Tax=Yarrowia lipolytica TaxID=4952 RepID=A0A1D8NES8_YARLL|nr:hypothetical protein YALI1_D20398g [Yarrowia lipolytica]
MPFSTDVWRRWPSFPRRYPLVALEVVVGDEGFWSWTQRVVKLGDFADRSQNTSLALLTTGQTTALKRAKQVHNLVAPTNHTPDDLNQSSGEKQIFDLLLDPGCLQYTVDTAQGDLERRKGIVLRSLPPTTPTTLPPLTQFGVSTPPLRNHLNLSLPRAIMGMSDNTRLQKR